MTFNLGSTTINKLNLGSTEIKKAYLGATLIHDTTGAAPSGPTFVKKSSLFLPNPVSTAFTLSHNMADTGNVLIAMVAFESGSTGTDTSIGSGGGNLPTYNGVAMTHGVNDNSSRRQVGIFAIHPNATGAADFVLDPGNGMRSVGVRLEEWSGINTTTFFNQVNSNNSGNGTLPTTITTTDADGVILGVACFGDELTAITASVGTLNEEGASGSAGQDIRAAWASVDVASAAATEGITFDQVGNVNAIAAIAELNPA